jgi:hypothetical protein
MRQEMKNFCLISLALALLVVPLSLSGQVEPVAGEMTIGALVEFAGRYSGEDNTKPDEDTTEWKKLEKPYWSGYETFNMETAVIYLTGKVGDKVSYSIGEALVMPVYEGDLVTPVADATLLDARITWNITESIALNMGRYIPGTSMSVSPHRLSVHHLVDPPMMIKGGGYRLRLIPLPRFQTGVGISAGFGPALVSWDFFNGTEVKNPDSLTDVDKCKGGVLKVAVNGGGFHAGVFYLSERSDSDNTINLQILTGAVPLSIQLDDSYVTQWGLELAYTSKRFIAAFEYLDTVLDFLEDDTKFDGVTVHNAPDLKQLSYYLLFGGNVGPAQIVFRYEFAEAGYDEFLNDIDGWGLSGDVSDQQVNYTLGVNYSINDNTTIALNYAWREPEEPEDIKDFADMDGDGDIDDLEWDFPDINELSVMIELDML